MKTKTEIKNKIKQLRHDRDLKPDNLSNYHFYKECMNAEINALQWALGYKSTRRYWCTGCGISHQNLKCPKCGNDTYLGNHDDKT
jgi:ribosomal protein S27AE